MSLVYNEIEDLEDELEMANSTAVELRALLDSVIGIVHDNTSDAEKVSDVRQLLREAGEL